MIDQRIQSVLRRLKECHILLLGDIMLDEYIWGSVHRISPEAPVPVVDVGSSSYVPGGAGNVAANIVSLGAAVSLVGMLGADKPGETLSRLIAECGVDIGGVIEVPFRSTTLKTRVIAHNHQLIRVDREDVTPIGPEDSNRVCAWVDRSLGLFRVCVLSDYAKGFLASQLVSSVIRKCVAASIPVVVDPKGPDFTKYLGATLITPNYAEARRAATQQNKEHTDPLEIGSALMTLLPGTAILITLGPEGVALFREGHIPVRFPSVARQVYDVTGAGDTLVATVSASLAAGASLEDAVYLGNLAAGKVVEKVGTSLVTLDDLGYERHSVTSETVAPPQEDRRGGCAADWPQPSLPIRVH